MRKQWSAYLFLAPTMILFGIFTVLAVIYAFYLSFHEWNILEPANRSSAWTTTAAVGRRAVRRRHRQHPLLHRRLGAADDGAGLLIALLLNNQIRARGFFRTLFYLPVVTPLVIAAIIWKWSTTAISACSTTT